MRLGQLLLGAFSLLACSHSVFANDQAEHTEPDVSVQTSFAEANPFGHVVNGEKNQLLLAVENKSTRNVTVLTVAGSFHHPESDKLVKNITALKYGIPLIQGVKISLPFTFHSEFKPGDLRLRVWLEHQADDEKYIVNAYDSIVTIVEPEGSIFDLKLLSTYLIVFGLFGGLAYFAYLSFVPQPKKSRTKPTVSSISAPTGTVTATGAGGYSEEWIPVHHLKKGKAKKDTGLTSGTSGDELSGAELSGTEGKRRKGRK